MKRISRIFSVVMLLLAVGVAQAWGSAVDDFRRKSNYEVTANPDGSYHFKLLMYDDSDVFPYPAYISSYYPAKVTFTQSGPYDETTAFTLYYVISSGYTLHIDVADGVVFNLEDVAHRMVTVTDTYENRVYNNDNNRHKFFAEFDWRSNATSKTKGIDFSIGFRCEQYPSFTDYIHYQFSVDPFVTESYLPRIDFFTLSQAPQRDGTVQNKLTWEVDHSLLEADFDAAFELEHSEYADFRTVRKLDLADGRLESDTLLDTHTVRYACVDDACAQPGGYYRIALKECYDKEGWANATTRTTQHGPSFIKDVCVSVAGDATNAKRQLTEKGYTVLPYDLNHGLQGKYVYLGYTRTTVMSEALTRLAIKAGSEWESAKEQQFVSDGYVMQPAPYIGSDNLNEGTAGNPLYLYCSRSKVKGQDSTSIVGIDLRRDELYGYGERQFVTDAVTTMQKRGTDLNQGCGDGYDDIQLVVALHKHASPYAVTAVSPDSVRVGHDCCSFIAHKKDYPETDFMEIATVDELFDFAARVNKNDADRYLKARLVNDIVVNEHVLQDGTLNTAAVGQFRTWTPLGHAKWSYQGVFDGNGHTIRGLYCDADAEYIGFAGQTSYATIKNLTIEDSYFKGTNYVGGVVGLAFNGTHVNNCHFDGELHGNYRIGGICGFMENVDQEISYCGTSGQYGGAGNMYVGGIVGYLDGNPDTPNFIHDCYSTCTLGSSTHQGGIIGRLRAGQKVVDCISVANTVGWNEGGVLNGNEVKPIESFVSGEVAYLLNHSVDDGTQSWGQLINLDAMPYVFSDERPRGEATVYRAYSKCAGQDAVFAYTNNPIMRNREIHPSQTYFPAKTPTCVENGNLEYWQCTVCGVLLADRYGLEELYGVPVLACSGKHEYDAHDVCVTCGVKRETIEDGITSAQAAVETHQAFDLMGRRVTATRKGIQIVRDEKGHTHKVIIK